MIMALMLVLLNASGVAPTPAELQDYKLKFRERGHHVHMDWGTTRTPDTGASAFTWGVGYEYYIDRQFNGVSVEVLGQKLGDFFKGPQDWWVGGGIAWWPIRTARSSRKQARCSTTWYGDAGARWGGLPIDVLHGAAMPYIYVQTTDDGRFSWSLGARIQY